MKLIMRISLFFGLCGMLLAPSVWAQTASVSGTITDADTGEALIGANVLVAGTVQGAATDVDGRYSIADLPAGTYTLTFSYIGYQNQSVDVTLAAGEARTLDMALTAGFDLDPIQVTAGRRQEKALDAPASIDVIGVREIEQDVTTSSVKVLRNTTGVDMAQTGIDRSEVVLRGFNNAFSGATYVLTDYRQAAVPSLGVNLYSIMPNMAIDLERVEVVRGPGSALYGAGVDAGVIHFFTKDPFRYPGATFSVSGGEQSLFNFQGRVASVVAEKVGLKVTGFYGQAKDFKLDPNDPLDAQQLATDGPRDTDFQKLNLNGTVEYRMSEGTSLIVNGGFSQLKAAVLSGIGTVQADGFGYSYGQVRFQSGDFFAQAYVNKNSAGDSFVYGGSPVVDKGALYNAQAQYDLDLANGREQLIMGVDLELTRPNTEGTILGRNENDDSIDEYGAYLQSTTAVSPKLDLTLALRGDYNNIVEKFQVSPRAAVVFKPSQQHTVRATYNRAFSSPGTNSLFLDIIADTVGGVIPVRGRGAASGFTWERNPAYAAIAGTDLVASSLNPATLGAPQPVGLPLDATYSAVYDGLAAIPVPVLVGGLRQAGLLPPPSQLPDEQAAALVGQLVQLLSPTLTQVSGFSQGVLARPNLSTGGTDLITDLVDIVPLDQTITQTFELGYKGIINEKVLIAVDAYYSQKKDFVGPLLMETPLVLVPSLSADLTGAVAAGISGNAVLSGALQQLGLSAAQVAATLVGLAADQLPGATTPVAIVQAAENDPGVGHVPELMLSYRNFGQLDYWGVDASVQVVASDQVTLFGNVSIVSDDFFDNEELDEENTSLSLALNAPTFKTKFGAAYTHPSGFLVNFSGRYTEGFPVRSGPYVGDVKSAFLLDVGAGYVFQNQLQGLRLDVSASNVLDEDYRQFIGAPKIGRLVIGRLTYTFGL